jgi:hypothetical protein
VSRTARTMWVVSGVFVAGWASNTIAALIAPLGPLLVMLTVVSAVALLDPAPPRDPHAVEDDDHDQ